MLPGAVGPDPVAGAPAALATDPAAFDRAGWAGGVITLPLVPAMLATARPAEPATPALAPLPATATAVLPPIATGRAELASVSGLQAPKTAQTDER